MDSPIVSGVWSLLRLRLRPSEASSAASNALQTSAGRRGSLAVPMRSGDDTSLPLLHHGQVEPMSRPFGAAVPLFAGGDVEFDGGEIVEENPGGWAALKRRETLHVAETPPARVDHAGRAALLRHETRKLRVIGHAAKGAEQAVRLPLSAAAATPEVAAPLDPSHFGQCRPRATDRTVRFDPAC